jgi:hypothetical protein
VRHRPPTAASPARPTLAEAQRARRDRPNTVGTVTQPHLPTLWLWAAVGLGVTAVTASVLLIATDGITGSSRWAHHPGVSAAPLLLIAAAIAAGSLAQPPRQGRRVMAVIAALAFTAWGLAQLLPNSSAAGYLNDTAILLFVTDAAYAINANARNAPPAPQPRPSHARTRQAAGEAPGRVACGRRTTQQAPGSRAVRCGDGLG